MRLTRRHLFWIIIFSCLVETRGRFSALNNNHSGKDFFADILSKVLQTSQAKDALLILRNSLLDEHQADDILDKIFAAASRYVPALYVNVDQTDQTSQVSFCGMSRELVVYIYISEREPDIVEGELVAEDMKRFIHDRIRPKVLVLMILGQRCRNLVMFFRAMWSRNILDAIVVEYSRVSEYSDKYSTIVHRYDPFTDNHEDEPYSADTVWFTDDFPNMRGYPLVYAFTRRPPYNDIIPATKDQKLKLKGIDKMILDVLAEKMNFTGIPKIMGNNFTYFKKSNDTQYGILFDIDSGKYDALMTSLPMWGKVYKKLPAIQYTYPLFLENWCFLIPKLLVKQNYMSGFAFKFFLLNFSIVGIFWLCSRLMNFNSKWHFVNIIGLMLGTSFPPVSAKLHERVILLSIIAVYASYSSTLFANLASISFKDNHVQYDHLQDLVNSDLTLMMDANILAIITQYNSVFKHLSQNSDKKIVTFDRDPDICLKKLLMYQNVTCFVEKKGGQLFAFNNMRNDEIMLKETKLCYLSPPVSKVFRKGSPYIKRISDIHLMLAGGGIYAKWWKEYLSNETKETTLQIYRDHQTNSMYVDMYYPMIYTLIIGYSISTFVFIGELIWKYFI